jgi:hypothetical protein
MGKERGLDVAMVGEIVAAIWNQHERTVHGFEYKGWRLQRGNGTADNSDHWWMTQIAGPRHRNYGPLKNKTELRAVCKLVKMIADEQESP